MRYWGLDDGPPIMDKRRQNKEDIIGVKVEVKNGKNYHTALLIIPNKSKPTHEEINTHLANKAMVGIYWIEYNEYHETVPSWSVKPLFEEEKEEETTPDAAANTTTSLLPAPSGNGNNNSNRRRSTSRGNNRRQSTGSSTFSRNNNSVQTNSRNNNPGGGSTGSRGGELPTREERYGLAASSSAVAVSTSNNAAPSTNKSFKSSASASASLSTTTDATKFDSRTAIQSNNKQSNNSSNNNSKKMASSNTNKKSKVDTISSFQPKTIDVVNDENGQKPPDFNTNGIDSNLLQPGVSVAFIQLDSSTIDGTISSRNGERLEILFSASAGRYIIQVGKVVSFVGEQNIIPLEVTGCRVVNRDGADPRIYSVKLLGYRNINEIEEGGYGWNKLKDSSAYRKFIHSKDTTGNKHSRPSSRQDSVAGHAGFDENTFLSPEGSREKANNSTGK